VNQSLIDLTEVLPDIHSFIFSPRFIFCRDARGGGDVARKGRQERKHVTAHAVARMSS
jgi:hypothetical protein